MSVDEIEKCNSLSNCYDSEQSQGFSHVREFPERIARSKRFAD